MKPLSFFSRFVSKVIVSCFSITFVQKTTQQKRASVEGSRRRTRGKRAAVMLQAIPSFDTNYSKNSLFISANTYEKYFVNEEYCIARHDDKMCFLPNCRYHITLIGNIKELLQKLDSFFFNCQHVDCLYTLFKYHFSDKIVLKTGQLFDNLQMAVHFNQQNRGVGRMPSIAKKRLLRKKYKKNLLSSFQKTKSRQTSGSVFADTIEQVKETKFESDLMKIVFCFLDGHGSYSSSLVSFEIKSLLSNHFLNSKEICINQLVVQMT